jgi:hypothetical protein
VREIAIKTGPRIAFLNRLFINKSLRASFTISFFGSAEYSALTLEMFSPSKNENSYECLKINVKGYSTIYVSY